MFFFMVYAMKVCLVNFLWYLLNIVRDISVIARMQHCEVLATVITC